MKFVVPKHDWLESWNYSYPFDLLEVYGSAGMLGYSYAYQNRKRRTIRLIEDVVAPGSTILDVAAAQGNFSLTLAEMGHKVTWNDLRGDLIEYVKMKYEFGDIQYAAGNAFDLDFPNLFDVVLITEIIEHVAHPDDFLSKIAKLVKPGGYIIMTTPNGGYFGNDRPKFSSCSDPSVFESIQFQPDSDGHIFLLHQEEVCNLANAAGLAVDQVMLFTNPLTNGHIKLGLALKCLPKRFVEWIEYAAQLLPLSIKKRLMVQMGARLRKVP